MDIAIKLILILAVIAAGAGMLVFGLMSLGAPVWFAVPAAWIIFMIFSRGS